MEPESSQAAPDSGTAGDGTHRILVVATEALVGRPLLEPLRSRVEGRDAAIFIICPALTGSALKHAMGDVDEAKETADERLEESYRGLAEEGLQVEGQVGDSDPILAIQDALAVFPADEIVLVTRTDDDARWLEDDLFERAKRSFEPEIVHVSLEGGGEEAPQVADVERAGEGVDPPPDEEVRPRSRNFPKLSVRDLMGVLVAVVGTIVLVVLAADCDSGTTALQRSTGTDGVGSDGGCVARNIIAGATALINIAHVVGLVLFESVGYRGGWSRMFALMSLVGTPLAIVASLLVH
jgi:hypothetical protein